MVSSRSKTVVYYLVLLLGIPLILGAGISPPIYEIPYVPGNEHILPFNVGGYENISLDFSCTEWLSYNNDAHIGEYNWIAFSITVRFPKNKKPDFPGEHRCGFIVKEYRDPNLPPEEFSGIRAQTQVGGTIIVQVPYPKKYLLLSLDITNANKGKPIYAGIHIKNFGNETIYNINPTLEILDLQNNTVERFNIPGIDKLLIHQEVKLWKKMDTNPYEAAKYRAIAYFDYGGEEIANDEAFFFIGKPYVNFLRATENVTAEKLNEYRIDVESWWGNTLTNVYAIVNVSNETMSREFKSVAIDLAPWSQSQLLGYFDTTGFSEGNYSVNITFKYYENLEHSISKGIYIHEVRLDKQKPLISKQTIIIVLLVFITLINIVFLLRRKKKEDQK